MAGLTRIMVSMTISPLQGARDQPHGVFPGPDYPKPGLNRNNSIGTEAVAVQLKC